MAALPHMGGTARRVSLRICFCSLREFWRLCVPTHVSWFVSACLLLRVAMHCVRTRTFHFSCVVINVVEGTAMVASCAGVCLWVFVFVHLMRSGAWHSGSVEDLQAKNHRLNSHCRHVAFLLPCGSKINPRPLLETMNTAALRGVHTPRKRLHLSGSIICRVKRKKRGLARLRVKQARTFLLSIREGL